MAGNGRTRISNDLEADLASFYNGREAEATEHSDPRKATAILKPKSKFALRMQDQSQREQRSAGQTHHFEMGLNRPTSQRGINSNPHVHSLLGDITEHKDLSSPATAPVARPTSKLTGFPLSSVLPNSVSKPSSSETYLARTLPVPSISAGPSMRTSVSEENDNILANMSPEVILAEQLELKGMLNEKTLAYIMSRRAGASQRA